MMKRADNSILFIIESIFRLIIFKSFFKKTVVAHRHKAVDIFAALAVSGVCQIIKIPAVGVNYIFLRPCGFNRVFRDEAETEAEVAIDGDNIDLYAPIIRNYEGNKLEYSGNSIKINGEIASKYTFKMDYYWMMGDNRHNSADSRYWGFVPEDHIVGKPIFIWLSLDDDKQGFFNRLRTERIFKFIHND